VGPTLINVWVMVMGQESLRRFLKMLP